MTFRLRHKWKDGAKILGAQLAHCDHCKTTRITDPSRHAEPRYLRRTENEAERDTFESPPCVEPVERRTRSTERRDRTGAELGPMARERAFRAAANAAPTDEEGQHGS